jgi:hypothetical protein
LLLLLLLHLLLLALQLWLLALQLWLLALHLWLLALQLCRLTLSCGLSGAGLHGARLSAQLVAPSLMGLP